MGTEIKSNAVKVKPTGFQDGSSSKSKFDPSIKKKVVIGNSIKQAVDSKHRSITSVSKTEVKGKAIASSSKTTTTTTKTTTKKTVKTREKKVFSLPGQKFDPPEEREPLRIFYESLSKQIPSSEMAEFWMMEHGLLSPEKAKKAHEKKQRKQKQIRMGIPIKSPPPPSRAESSKKPLLPPPNRGESSKKPLTPPPNRGESSNKPPPPPNRGESSKKPPPPPNREPMQVSKNGDSKAKKIIMDESDDEDDFVLSHKRRKG